MKKKLFYVALAITALASCSSNDFVGDESPQGSIETNGAITFQYNVQNATRGTSDDATKLNNQFIVWGEKNENQSASGAAPTDGNLVFPNYIVNYIASTANTTTSNTNNWEYVGFKFDDTNTSYYSTNITPNTKFGDESAPAQTIKYWDNNAESYTFTAISAKSEDISNGLVKIQKNETGTDVYAKGYTVTLAKSTGETPTYPSLSDLYVSDRINIARGEGYTHNAVQFNFRNSLSHIRAGIYETIPGYSISSIKFYVNTSGENPEQTQEAKVSETSAFGVIAPNIGTNYEGTLTVTYYDNTNTATENHPKLSFSGTTANNLILGTYMSTLSTSNTLSTTSATPTWDTDGGTFTSVLPQINNTTNMKLKVDYTLYNSVTDETINITGKTAEVPAQYLQWKSNYKYTYLFKITDDNLYPITFDACYIEDENGNQETITTVSEPSITTFGVSAGKYVSGGNEYAASTDVYATVMDASALATLDANNFSIYDVTTSDATNFPVTEASVAEALIEGPTWTKAQADNKKITCAVGPTLTFQNTVPAEDGTTITLDASNEKAAKFTTAATKKYALVYQKTAATYTVDSGNTYADETAFNNAGTLYTSSACTDVATWGNASTPYFKRTAVSDKGVYAVKIVTVP